MSMVAANRHAPNHMYWEYNMAKTKYTTEGQIHKVSKRLITLSSFNYFDVMSREQLLETLKTIHENHILLNNLIESGKPPESSMALAGEVKC